MTDEQLKKGQELKSKITRLKKRVEYWECADGISEIDISYPEIYPSGSNTFRDKGEYVDFEVLRTLTLQSMRTELKKLEKEYREL